MSVPPLTAALGIPGAHAVSLLDPDGPNVLWWAGETAPTEQEAAAAVTLAAAAAGLVLLNGNGADELSDILLTSADAFHVVRLVGEEAPLVAHLTLRRADANLAMARREFGTITTSYARELDRPTNGGAPALTAPPPNFDLTPRDLGGGTVDLSASAAGLSSSAADFSSAAGLTSSAAGFSSADGFTSSAGGFSASAAGLTSSAADLPRRHRVDPSEPDESPGDLLDLLGRPYVTDDAVLDRVLVALRSL